MKCTGSKGAEEDVLLWNSEENEVKWYKTCRKGGQSGNNDLYDYMNWQSNHHLWDKVHKRWLQMWKYGMSAKVRCYVVADEEETVVWSNTKRGRRNLNQGT